jgi:hypothetical protein
MAVSGLIRGAGGPFPTPGRFHECQLGNSVLGAQVAVAQLLTTRFPAKNEGYN